MRIHASFATVNAAFLACIALSTLRVLASKSQCPVVGPTPPKSCDGSDGVWFPVSVAGRGTYCTMGPEICVAQNFAACPGPATDLPFGAKCKQLETKVYGCVPRTSCHDGVLDDILKGNDAACDTATDASTTPQKPSVTTVVITPSPTTTVTRAPTPSATLLSPVSSTTPTQSTPPTGTSPTPSTSLALKSLTPSSSTPPANPDDLDNFVPDDMVIDDNMALLPVPGLVDTFTIGSIETTSAGQPSESASIPEFKSARQLRSQEDD